jgi:hypothetical protein
MRVEKDGGGLVSPKVDVTVEVPPVESPDEGDGDGSGSGSGSGGKKKKKAEDDGYNKNNSFDKLYNVLEEIEKLTREREKLERRYQRLLDRQIGTARELYEYSKKQADNLRDQAE